MNAPFTDIPEFSIGKPVRRSEDPSLVQGRGNYSDDVSVAGQAHGVVLRSSHAHGIIKGIDAGDAWRSLERTVMRVAGAPLPALDGIRP